MRHLSPGASISPQTCDNKNGFLEVNFYDNKTSSDYNSFTDVFEFSSDLKKTSDFKITLVLLMFLSFFSSQVRSEDFM